MKMTARQKKALCEALDLYLQAFEYDPEAVQFVSGPLCKLLGMQDYAALRDLYDRLNVHYDSLKIK